MMKWMGATGPLRDDYEETNRVSSYRGYLFKLRRSQNLLAPQWGKRWFSIEGHFLKWYRQENDLFSSGMVDLKYIRGITKLDNHGQYAFMISSDERTLILRSSTVNEMQAWIRTLHMHADKARGGKGTMVVSDFNQMPLNNNHSSKNYENSYHSNASSSHFSGATTPTSTSYHNNNHNNDFKQPKRNRGLRASLTLEQELDLTLKKLDDLAKEVSIVQSPHSSRNSSNETGSREGGGVATEEGRDREREKGSGGGKHFQKVTNKLVKNVVQSPNNMNESMESISDAVVRSPKHRPLSQHPYQQHQQQHRQLQGKGGERKRDEELEESFEAEEADNTIEDISLSKPYNRVRSFRNSSNTNNNNNNKPDSLSYRNMSSTSEIQLDRDRDRDRNREDSSFDEYDHSYQPAAVVNKSSHHRGNSNRNPNQVNSTIQSTPSPPQIKQGRSGANRLVYHVTDLSPSSPDVVESRHRRDNRDHREEDDDEFDYSSQRNVVSSSSSNTRSTGRYHANSNSNNNSKPSTTFNVKKPSHAANSRSKEREYYEREEDNHETPIERKNNRKENYFQSPQSTDSPDFVIESIPSIDTYNDNLRTRNVVNRRDQEEVEEEENDHVIINKRKGGKRNEDQGTGGGGVRSSRDFHGIKSAW
jgi:hypothetical protein